MTLNAKDYNAVNSMAHFTMCYCQNALREFYKRILSRLTSTIQIIE